MAAAVAGVPSWDEVRKIATMEVGRRTAFIHELGGTLVLPLWVCSHFGAGDFDFNVQYFRRYAVYRRHKELK
jgi:hypothetical protein